jgi:hypothetical protein
MRRMTRVFASSVTTSLVLAACPLLAQQPRELPTPNDSSPIQLAVVEIVSQEIGSRGVETPKQLLDRQTSDSPIGTGIKPELQTRKHLGDEPNLIPQLRQASSPKPLVAKPLDQPVPLRDPKSTTPTQPTTHSIELPVEIKTQTLLAPKLTVDVAGPATLVAQQEGSFAIRVKNEGDGAASGVVLDVAFSREVTITKSSFAPEIRQSIYRFVLDDLEVGESSTLNLQLLAEEPGAIDLATRLSLSTQANWKIKVAEAAPTSTLQLKLEGADHVKVGEAADQKITVFNPGAQSLQGVEVSVRVPTHLRVANDQELHMKVGTLAAGASRTFVLKSVAKRAAEHPIEVIVTAGGKSVYRQQKNILVDEEQIALAIMGPAAAEPNESATFGVELSNLTDGPTESLAVQLLLPADMIVLTLDRSASFDAKRNLLIWQIDSVQANERVVLRFKALPKKAGDQILRAQVNTAEKVMMQKQLTVHVSDAAAEVSALRR